MTEDERTQRLRQWYNVYGWTDEACAAAAASDARLQQLLDIEMAGDMPDEARQIRDLMTRFETCHQACLRNVDSLVEMVANLRPSRVIGCGENDPAIADQLRAAMAPLAAWVDGEDHPVGLDTDLGARTVAKQWLIACLCKMIAEQLHDPDVPQPRWPGDGSGAAQ